jgi:hypothetical protein
MKPITPIVPGVDLTVTTYAADQPEYISLPTFVDDDGCVTSRWKFTWYERIQILFHGQIWHSQLTFGKRLQPIKMSTECPLPTPFSHPDEH